MSLVPASIEADIGPTRTTMASNHDGTRVICRPGMGGLFRDVVDGPITCPVRARAVIPGDRSLGLEIAFDAGVDRNCRLDLRRVFVDGSLRVPEWRNRSLASIRIDVMRAEAEHLRIG